MRGLQEGMFYIALGGRKTFLPHVCVLILPGRVGVQCTPLLPGVLLMLVGR